MIKRLLVVLLHFIYETLHFIYEVTYFYGASVYPGSLSPKNFEDTVSHVIFTTALETRTITVPFRDEESEALGS